MEKRRIEIQPEMNNVLELDDPQRYGCRIVGYVLERSLLVVEVKQTTEQFYAVFPDVHHYDGNFIWQGASLRIASRDEQFEYTLARSVVATTGVLFVFDGADGTINLMGGDWVAIFDDLPDRFKSSL